MCKECSVSKSGSSVCGEVSVLCSWHVNYILSPIPGFLLWPAVTFLIGNLSSHVNLGHVYIQPVLHPVGVVWIFSFTSPSLSLSPHCASQSTFSSKTHLCSLLSVSCSQCSCHSCLSIATVSCSKQFGPREPENWNILLSLHRWSSIIPLSYSAFYFRRPISPC